MPWVPFSPSEVPAVEILAYAKNDTYAVAVIRQKWCFKQRVCAQVFRPGTMNPVLVCCSEVRLSVAPALSLHRERRERVYTCALITVSCTALLTALPGAQVSYFAEDACH